MLDRKDAADACALVLVERMEAMLAHGEAAARERLPARRSLERDLRQAQVQGRALLAVRSVFYACFW